MRYVDAAARDASEPLPDTGELAYLTGTGQLQVYDGSAWVNRVRADGDTLTGALTWDNLGTPSISIGLAATAGIKFLTSQLFPTPVNQAGGMRTAFGSGSIIVYAGDEDGASANTRLQVIPDPDGVNAPSAAIDGSLNEFRLSGAHLTFADAGAVDDLQIRGPDGQGFYWKQNDAVAFVDEGGVEVVQIDAGRYTTTNASNSGSVREVFVGTTVPDNGWGKDGDIFIRYLA